MTIVVPLLFNSLSDDKILSPFTLSKLPVGSSANKIAGLDIIALAIATRYC
ncbi:conserved hypothetical protein [Xenorhabdus nematophila ATCC 19061]|uniref:Uncharacterized protein n=1 Tax=Xenorhabdus nematophila (strain ATCC 19061 / DSM 3370 / CCUG 14189 / LMG 1036 / NCIMB 9965 / AN6) TaxID=406817 RepID=D3VEW6_XENNA|nr:conserved hypothetical protein [Xenorhabdus nematophila ATCC 19061]CEK23092.1 conserved hypothetical protein [Xenorhabdus nematophila AN6/1]